MIRHPGRYYVHYLLSRRVLKTEDILSRMDELKFPMPCTEKELQRLIISIGKTRNRMVFPPGFDPTAKNFNVQTADFLSRWGIYDIWSNDQFTSYAIDLLCEPLIARMIEALLLAPLSPATIASRVARRFGLPPEVMNVRVIKSYSHYFWDVTALSMAEWRVLVHKWMGEGTDNPLEFNSDFLAALNAPRSPAGAALVLALTDRNADSLNDVQIYQTFRDMGFNMFMGHAMLSTKPSLQRTQAAFMAYQLVRGASDDLNRHRGGSAELLDQLNQIGTAYDNTRVLSVEELPALAPSSFIETSIEEEKHE